jgi:hypothetical protein
MATTGTAFTYADLAKRLEDKPGGKRIGAIVEMLSQTNEVLDDMLWIQANDGTGHRTTVRTGLPQATWRLLNYGVPNAKSTTAQIRDSCGNLEAFSLIDSDIVSLSDDKEEFRLSENRAFIEGMSQQFAQTLIYGNVATNPERFQGLAPRYNTILTANAASAANVVDMGGTGSTNTSIWIVSWGSDTTHGIYPTGSVTGLQSKDLGELPVQDINGNTYMAYREHHKWSCGLTVRDWRYNVRLANIDVTLLNGGSAANLINGIVRALYRLPTTGAGTGPIQTSDANNVNGAMGRTVIYCNRMVRTFLDLQAMNKTNVLLNLGEFNGRPVTTFRGVPVRTVDAILNTEARVV